MKPERKGAETIDAYIAACPRERQPTLQEIRRAIKEAAPQAEETIAYKIPTFTLNGTLVHFGLFNNHVGFYPTSSGITRFTKELARYKSTRGAVQFPLDEPMPLELIRKIVEFRVTENTGNDEGKSAKRRK